MASDLVNSTAKSQLSHRNQEPTHLKGGEWEVLGGRSVDTPANDPATTPKAGGPKSADTSVPRSVAAEKSHLPSADSIEDKLELAFGEEADHTDVDDLDKELDDLDDLKEIEIEVGKKDDDDDDKSDKPKVDEATEDDDPDGGKGYNFDKKDVDEDDDSEDDDDKKDLKEDDDNPFAKKKDDDDDDQDDEKKDKKDKTKITVSEDDEEDDDKKKVEESFRVVISTPAANLFESAGLAPKTQKKVAVIFEQAIRSNTKQIAKQLHEHYAKKYRRQINERDGAVQKQVDAYLSFVVEEWMKHNKVAVRTSLRAQLAEEFMSGLQNLFKEHYIDVPESKIDVVKQLSRQVASLKENVNGLTADRIKLRRLAESANKARIVAEFATGMSSNETSRLGKLAEDVKYENAKDFRGKLALLKENYFGKKDGASSLKHLPEETLAGEAKPATTTDPNDIGSIVAASIAQQAKSNW
jgi:hypothetical protein